MKNEDDDVILDFPMEGDMKDEDSTIVDYRNEVSEVDSEDEVDDDDADASNLIMGNEIITTVANLLNEVVNFVALNCADEEDHLRLEQTDFNISTTGGSEELKKSTVAKKREWEANEYRRYICYWCDKRFQKYSQLRHHTSAHVDKTRIKCTLCEKSFTQKSTLTVHMMVHTGERPYKCLLCPKGFVTATKLKKHGRVHTGEKPFSCDVCEAKFGEAATLRKHKERHVAANVTATKEQKLLQCSLCDSGFTRSEDLKVHKKEKHNKQMKKKSTSSAGDTEKEGDYVCEVCQKRFSFKRYLVKHMKRHTDATRFECTQCDKTYAEKHKLSSHVKSVHGDHVVDTPNTEQTTPTTVPTCSVCNLTFKFPYSLKKHMIVHTNSRPFDCSMCNGSYKTQQDLNRHQKIHATDRPHKCELCGKGFVATGDLKRHLRTHTGAKPYICELCNQGFSQSSSLRKHKEKKHATVSTNEQCDDGNDMENRLATVQDILNWIGQQPNTNLSENQQMEIDYV